ncbi:MAG: DUF222 domain-containing protein [Actinomycetota bacterium]
MTTTLDDPPLLRALADLPLLASTTPIEALSAEGLADVLHVVRQGQAALASLVVRIGVQADALAVDGRSPPAPDLLSGHGRTRGRTARTEADRAKAVKRLPKLGDAVQTGRMGPDALDSLARHTRSLTDDEMEQLDVSTLLHDAGRLPADTFDAAVKRAVRSVGPDTRRASAERKRAASEFRHWFDDDTGMGHFRGSLDPERYEALTSAVDQHTSALAAASGGTATKNANLAAAALVELVTHSGARKARHPHLIVVVHGEEAQTADGRELCPESLSRLSCDATAQQVTLDDEGLPLRVGRRYRTATDAQWTAIRAIHATCAWAACHRPLSHCQLHHLRPWSEGGSTDLDNLLPLCSEHHHQVHEGAWSLDLLANRALVITRPDGVVHAITDPPRRTPGPEQTGPLPHWRNSGVLENPGPYDDSP